MTFREESLYIKDWLRIARQDWHRIHVLMNDEDVEGAAFFLQQTLEKYLKAYLLSKGWKLKKVHTLQSLLDEAADFDGSLAQFRPLCERASGFYLVERYPSLGKSDLKIEHIRNELIETRKLIENLFAEEPPT